VLLPVGDDLDVQLAFVPGVDSAKVLGQGLLVLLREGRLSATG
jgi:hypothetical protein